MSEGDVILDRLDDLRDVTGTRISGAAPIFNGSGQYVLTVLGSAAFVQSSSFVDATVYANAIAALQSVDSSQGNQLTSLTASVGTKAPIASPNLTGSPTAPTASPGNDSTLIATTAFVAAIFRLIVGMAPAQLDTLQEIAAQMSADETTAAALALVVAGKLTAASNLSDLANASTARANLGLGTAATANAGSGLGNLPVLGTGGSLLLSGGLSATTGAFSSNVNVTGTVTAGTLQQGASTLNSILAAYVGNTRTITTTAPLTGGGDLSTNRTLSISAATTSAAGSMSAADKAKLDGLPRYWSQKSTVAQAVITGNGTTQVFASFSIPVNAYAQGDLIRVTFGMSYGSAVSNVYVRLNGGAWGSGAFSTNSARINTLTLSHQAGTTDTFVLMGANANDGYSQAGFPGPSVTNAAITIDVGLNPASGQTATPWFAICEIVKGT